jgi:hypothetical protein
MSSLRLPIIDNKKTFYEEEDINVVQIKEKKRSVHSLNTF